MSSSTTAAAAREQSIRWGRFGEDNGGKLDSHLPPRVFIGLHENGVKEVIEYRFDKKGNMLKVMTIISPVRKFEHELKSGDAVKEGAGSRLPVPPNKGVLLGQPPASGPLALREAADDVRRIMYDDRTVRVTNLSEDTTELALTNLFEEFGYATNVYIPVDGKTGSGRAVGFVKFAQRREAECAISILSEAYTYAYCKLQVGWAAPRVN